MSSFDFINSPDIREHWQKIGFVPNALETAWLIWQSNKLTVAQKHSAWEEIISNMPDYPIPPSSQHHGKPIFTYRSTTNEFKITRRA